MADRSANAGDLEIGPEQEGQALGGDYAQLRVVVSLFCHNDVPTSQVPTYHPGTYVLGYVGR